MAVYKNRASWTSTNASGRTLSGSKLRGVAWHYPGTTQNVIGAESESQTASRLRGYRNFHVSGRGWRDIGYNVAFDQSGRVWMLRTTAWRGSMVGAHCASSSNRDANEEYVGALLILGDQEAPSDAMLEAINDWYWNRFRTGWSGRTDNRGHGQVPGASTACPGSEVLDLLAAGVLPGPQGGGGGSALSWGEDLSPGTPVDDITGLSNNTLPDSWGRSAADLLGYAAAGFAFARQGGLYREIWFGDKIKAPAGYPDAAKENNPNWEPQRFLRETVDSTRYHIEPNVARILELVEAMADVALGADVAEIKAHIDVRAAEAAAERQAIADEAAGRDSDILALIAQYGEGELDAAEVVEGIRALIHGATAPVLEDDGA